MIALFKSKKKRDVGYWEEQLLLMEQVRERTLKDIERLDKSKMDAFELGRKETSQARRIVQAENIKKADNAIKAYNARLTKINQQIDFIDQVLVRLKTVDTGPIADFEPIVADLEALSDEERVKQEKFATARGGLDAAIPRAEDIDLDPQTQEILNMFDKASQMEDRPRAEASSTEAAPAEKEGKGGRHDEAV